MLQGNKKIQLRRCATCQKVGHNKSTCQTIAPPPRSKSVTSPLRFFVHHVDYKPTSSPHILNLKTDTKNIWDAVNLPPPEQTPSLYQSYHQTPSRATIAPTRKISPLPNLEVNEKKNFSRRANAEKTKELYSLVQKSFVARLNFIRQLASRHLSIRRLAPIIIVLIVVAVIPQTARGYYDGLMSTKDLVTENSTAGFIALQDSTHAIRQADLAAAKDSTALALQKFNTATDILKNNHHLLQTLALATPILGSEFLSRQKILLAGQEIATGNYFLLGGIKTSQIEQNKSLVERLKIISDHLAAALPNYQEAETNLADVDANTLPFEYQAQFNNFRSLFTGIIGDFKNLNDLGESLQEIFGGQGQRRYLVIFQNQNEIRPTGGFIGSLAIVDIKDGQIVKLDVPAGGSYDFQGQLNETVEPPAPLLLSNKRWEFQDANWFPDFPASAEKILWFYRHSRGVTADGVIAINASVLERLLGILGPISDEKRQITLSADNALPTLQQIVENGPEKKDNKPKQIIADLAPRFVDLLTNAEAENIMPLLTGLQEALEQKEIQAYFTDNNTEAAMKTFGWSGQLLANGPTQDFLMVVNTNIQGQKSDAKIKQTINHQAMVEEDGSIIDTITITREHTGQSGEKLYGQTNIDYLRLYVPIGSVLLAGSGFTWPDDKGFRAPANWSKKDEYLLKTEKEIAVDNKTGTRITEEFNKTAFGNWVITEPGETSQVRFSYRLPFKIKQSTNAHGGKWQKLLASFGTRLADYQLVVEKQSGNTSDFESQIIFPDGWFPFWKEGTNITLAKNGASIANDPLKKDSIWSVLAKN